MPQDTQTFVELFLGEMTVSQWFFNLILMGMGILLYVLNRVKNRKDKSYRPSLKFYFKDIDNIISLVISVILTYILIRFYSNYHDSILAYLPQGLKMTPYFAMVVVGFAQHWISEWINKKTKSKPKKN
jgi:hypothetical protein